MCSYLDAIKYFELKTIWGCNVVSIFEESSLHSSGCEKKLSISRGYIALYIHLYTYVGWFRPADMKVTNLTSTIHIILV
jgi:hypothetical protein